MMSSPFHSGEKPRGNLPHLGTERVLNIAKVLFTCLKSIKITANINDKFFVVIIGFFKKFIVNTL